MIQRYEPTPYFVVEGKPHELYIRQTFDGEYVKYFDYKAEIDAKDKRIQEMTSMEMAQDIYIEELEKKVKELEGK